MSRRACIYVFRSLAFQDELDTAMNHPFRVGAHNEAVFESALSYEKSAARVTLSQAWKIADS